MRASWVLVLLAVAMLPTPGSAQASDERVLDFPAAPGAPATTVNITSSADAGATLVFAFSTTAAVHAAYVTLNRSSQRIDVPLALSGAAWRGTLPVATPELTMGNWTATCHVIGPEGGQTQAGQRTLHVIGNDTAPPSLEVEGAKDGRIVIGPTGVVRAKVSDLTLSRVTYRLDGLPTPLPLLPPYELSASSFLEGNQTLNLVATDRAGQATSKDVKVVFDAHPPQLTVTHALFAYLNDTAFTLDVGVKELTNYTVRVSAFGQLLLQPGNSSPSSPRPHAFRPTPTALGNATLFIEVRDALGNVATNRTTVQVLPPQADYRLIKLEATPARPLSSSEIALSFEVEQVGGPTPRNVTLQWTGVSLPPSRLLMTGLLFGKSFATVRLPPGQHALTARVEPPPGITDTNLTNQERRVDLEVFLGRVAHGDAVYDIRVGANGLPSVAVGADGATYPLTLRDRGLGAVYTFEVGGQTLEWSPVAQSGTGTSSAATTGSSETPLPFAWAALALVAAALALRRRRA